MPRKKKLPSARWFRDAERQLYAEQEALIVREFDRQAADTANYGWGVEEGEDVIAISTKIYRSGRPILISIKTFGQRPDHSWE